MVASMLQYCSVVAMLLSVVDSSTDYRCQTCMEFVRKLIHDGTGGPSCSDFCGMCMDGHHQDACNHMCMETTSPGSPSVMISSWSSQQCSAQGYCSSTSQPSQCAQLGNECGYLPCCQGQCETAESSGRKRYCVNMHRLNLDQTQNESIVAAPAAAAPTAAAPKVVTSPAKFSLRGKSNASQLFQS